MRSSKKEPQPAYKKKYNENVLGMVMAFIAIVAIIAVVGVNSFSLLKKQAEYKNKEAQLQTQIDEQRQRETDLQEYSLYTKTKKYVEEVAKEKLGLVYEDEIIFKKDK